MTGAALPRARLTEEAMQLGTETLGLFLVLKAFASGSVALTGTEAIANGVPAFKPPEAKNAATALVIMAALLAVLFIGITVIADAYQIVPSEEGSGGPTVIALVAQTAFGVDSPLYYLFQTATALILFLAANTSYNAFPRLAALLAEDGYMPRQFSFRGDRLAFSWGIILLSAVAVALIVYFGGVTTLLIPLYSVGVFVCFTLSQGGMVLHWLRGREPGWRWRLAINAVGMTLTAVVLVVVASVKFFAGAYLVVILIPVLVGMMLFINRQYAASRRELAVRPDFVVPGLVREERAIVPIPSLNRAAVQAVNVARSMSDQVTAVYISDDPEDSASMRARWDLQMPGVPLVIVESPYRALDRTPPRLSRRPRQGLAAGQARSHHVRGDPRVRRPPLVGADPLQPVGSAVAERPAGPTTHRRGQRALPPGRAGRGAGGRAGDVAAGSAALREPESLGDEDGAEHDERAGRKDLDRSLRQAGPK